MPKKIALVAALLVLATPGGDPPEFTPRVEVHGDLARAAHVVVVVPGSDVDDQRFGATVGRMARDLHASVGRADVAVVAWLGYRTPSGLGVDAAGGRLARAGAVALTEYVRTLPGHVRLMCHSYGSVVCGLAQPPVDDVVHLGSPGVRSDPAASDPAASDPAASDPVASDPVASGTRVWAARGGRDWTRWVPSVRLGDLGHGADPVDPAFGARVFDVGDIRHDEYFREGTASLRALARIAVGEAP